MDSDLTLYRNEYKKSRTIIISTDIKQIRARFLTIYISTCKITTALQKDVHAEIAQLVEHATENRGVPSPILGLGTLADGLAKKRGRSTVVVRLLAKEKVVGSNPIARSDIEKYYRHGVVAKW